MLYATIDRRRWLGTAAMAWCAGLVSAVGIGIVRWSVTSVVSGGGALAGLFLLIMLGAGFGLQAPAWLLMRAVVQRSRGTWQGGGRVAALVLVLGAVGLVALNFVLVSGPYLPPFGLVSILLLCSPYPLAFAVLAVRGRTVVAAAGAAALLLAAGVVPLHALQEHIAARVWLSRHPGLDHALLQGVIWPGGEQEPFTVGRHGVRTTVFFQDSNMDGNDDGVVTVAPATTDPCAPAATMATFENVPEEDDDRIGTVETLPVTGCTPDGKGGWRLRGNGFTGYALRRNGVLVTVCADSYRTGDDLRAVARTIHPLDDHQLWPYLSRIGSLDWPAM